MPDPPDKGDRIRAHHEVRILAERHHVHLVCIARSPAEAQAAEALRRWCASVHTAVLQTVPALAVSAVRFALGGCLNEAFYNMPQLHRAVRELQQRERLDAAVIYSVPMAQYVPAELPLVADLVDVDSEKFYQYAEARQPGWAYRLEARRLRKVEAAVARRAVRTYLTTENEAALLRSFAPGAVVEAIENGIDGEYFDPRRFAAEHTRDIVFTGAMGYFPNVDAVRWYADEVLPAVQRQEPGARLVIVGRDPSPAVLALGERPGVEVTGAVPDVRPYLARAAVLVAPLRIARGIQNKVLEGLAMGKRVLVTPAVTRTFGGKVPPGVEECGEAAAWQSATVRALREPADGAALRAAVLARFDWRHMERLSEALAAAATGAR